MPKKTATTAAKKRATSKKSAPQTLHHVPPAPLPRRKVEGVWRWYTHALQPIRPLTAEELEQHGLENG